MLTIRGKTFNHVQFLKSIRARYDGERRCWTHHGPLSDADRATLASLAGVTVEGWRPVTVPPPPPPVTRRAEPAGPIVHGNTTYQDYFAEKGAPVHFGFDSIADQVEFCRAIPYELRHDYLRDSAWRTDYDWREFCGTPDYDTALEMLELGTWSEGIELASEITEFLAAQHAKKRKRQHSLVGGHVNVGRLLAGNPKHMLNRPKQDGSRFVTLFVDIAHSAEIDAINAAIRAAMIAALCDLLENNGYRCEIIAAATPWCKHNRNAAYSMTVTLKRAGDRLNLSDIVFALGHPSYLRRIIFSIVVSQDALHRIWKNQGIADRLFTDANPTSKTEFYIPVLHQLQQPNLRGTNIDKALQMFNLLVPDGFPISLDHQGNRHHSEHDTDS